MATRRVFLSLFLLLQLILLVSLSSALRPAPSRQQCGGPADIVVTQRPTGRVVEGKAEYAVAVQNRCRGCAQSAVVLRCFGLSSVEPVDTAAIRPLDGDGGEDCVVAGGRTLPPADAVGAAAAPVRFTYAWMTPQDFPVISTKVHC
ncbi:uncharacterized protein LOC109726213 [Ananas comosus]|uniref:Uncharacterized protein LOC109726213 n=1 Tax=Ananas comosus TaxID=4615 RepID=A0A6P5GTR1_ANACO|nr:uncharacterized protein LOC109726213 [Ananas comosus]